MSHMRLVFLHGPAAAGKLTVAQALGHLTGMPVFHNHLVVDVLLEVFEFGSPSFVALREQFWLSTFEEGARSGGSMIFTFCPEETVKPGFSHRAASVVTRRGGQVHFVELLVSDAAQEQRIENPDRRRFKKLSSRSTLRALRARTDVGPMDIPPTDLSLDTESISAAEAARKIHDTFRLTTVAQPRGYGD